MLHTQHILSSILEEVHSPNSEYITIHDRKVVKHTGNIQLEYEALRQGAIFYDSSNYGIFQLSGERVDPFLEELTTKEIQYLNIGNVSECYMLNEDGEILGEVLISKRENDYLIVTPWESATAIKEWITRQIENSEYSLQFEDMYHTLAMISIEGSKSWKIVKELLSYDIETLPLRGFTSTSYNHMDVIIIRIGQTSEYGYLLLGNPVVMKDIYQELQGRIETSSVMLCESGFECVELAMLEVHQPNLLRETKEFGNIFELAQQWQIQYDKEDYIGYEAIKALFHETKERSVVGYTSLSKEPQLPHTKIYDGKTLVGEVVYSKISLNLNKVLGIAILNTPYANSGLELSLCDSKDESSKEYRIRTVSGPFIRPLSWDEKME